MARESECIKDINTFEKVLNDLDCTRLFNISFGISKEYYDENKSRKSYEYSALSPDFYTLVLHPNLVNDNRDKIEKILIENGNLRKKKILEKLKQPNKKISLRIDKYLNDEIFLRDIINLYKDREITLLFYNTIPSYNLKFLFQKEKVMVFLNNSNNEHVVISDDWFTKHDFERWNEKDSYDSISYNQLLNGLDCFEQLSNISDMSISNITNSILIKVNTKRKNILERKIEINSIYLEKLFDILRKYRSCGYTNRINVVCDSLYDVSCSKFNYDSCGVTFTDSEFDMDTVNKFVGMFKRDIKNNINSNYSLSDKLHYIFKYLYTGLIDQSSKKGTFEMLSIKNQIYGFAYDLCKFAGLKPIKVPGRNLYYFFEEHNKELVEFDPYYIEMIYESAKFDYKLLDSNIETALWNVAFEDLNKQANSLNDYKKYLVCDSVDEIIDVYKNSINNSDNLYFRDIDKYEDELGYITSILMDLSEEDYIEFINNHSSNKTIDDVLNDVSIVANQVIKNKNKQIGIVMNHK